MTAVLRINEELNGIELYFDSKPEQEVLTHLKSNGFRFSGFKKCWWNKRTEKSMQVANDITKQKNTSSNTITNTSRRDKGVKMSLWDATKWNEFEVNKEQEVKEMAKEIRKHVRQRFPQCKFSVTTGGSYLHSTINIKIKSSPYEKGSAYLTAIYDYCNSLLNNYRHCYSPADPYTDYAGSYNFYGHVSLDWEYKETEQTEEIKEEMALFDSKMEEFQEAEKEKKEKEFQEYLKEQELKNAEYKRQQQEEKKQIENIYSNIVVKQLNEEQQYFVIDSQFANLNKNSTLDQYKDEVTKGDFTLENVKITKEVHFNTEEALNNFSNMLLNEFDFLAETGGSFTEDHRVNSMIDYYNMDDLEKRTVQWNLYGVGVYYNGKLKFIVDAQGYSYARYVGLVDNAKIEKSISHKQTLNEEVQELKNQADKLEDISTSVIEELNMFETWKKEDWNKYKAAFKEKLRLNNFKLNKNIIQQVEIEELKISLYRILQEVDSIQEQFKNAELEKGEKYTLFYISDLGSLITERVTYDSYQPMKYAQYDNAIKLTYKPENKRNLYYRHFYSDLLMFKGWHSLPDTVLNNVEVRPEGMKIIHSKYHSCDKRQFDEVLDYLNEKSFKPLINTYKPSL
ncbi:LPD29 domain-containing protein [Bacillus subtilis]|uniref:LPD29 domain-containing protein n=1 Tax=Bacillus subtilis TaxID=1423 RepID=UPI002DBB082E|nr:LPD29 domain-containing protein [Bacillus subtilis]MEC4030223.1 LPD29 domain-containing protein [Bacillus subtilis]